LLYYICESLRRISSHLGSPCWKPCHPSVTLPFEVAGKRAGKASRLIAAGDRPATIRLSKCYRKLRCRRRQGRSNTDTRPTPGCYRPSPRAKSAPGKYPHRVAGSLRPVQERILAATGKPKW
jgi:hypothetical protein